MSSLMHKVGLVLGEYLVSNFSSCNSVYWVWMFYGRTNQPRVNKIHVRALRIACNDSQLELNYLLQRTNSFAQCAAAQWAIGSPLAKNEGFQI